MSRTYKPVPECPPKLARIIKGVNMLPDNVDEMFEKIGEFASEYNNRSVSEILNKDLNYQKTFFQRFENIIGNKKLSQLLIGKTDVFQLDVILKFAEFVQAKKVLRYIAETNRDEDSPAERLKRYFALTPKGHQPFIKLFFYYDYHEAKLDFKWFDYIDFFALLKRLKGSLKRIKLCPVCDSIFWAKKTNALTCGNQKCVDALQYKKKKLKEKENNVLVQTHKF